MDHRAILHSCVFLAAAAGLFAATASHAQDWGRYRGSGPLVSEMSLDTAVDRVRKRTGGRVLSADTVQDEGRRVHEVKVLTDQGRVRRYRIDQDSGEQLGPSRRPEYSSGGRQARPGNGRYREPAPPTRRSRRP